jgi:hypothetical protein
MKNALFGILSLIGTVVGMGNSTAWAVTCSDMTGTYKFEEFSTTFTIKQDGCNSITLTDADGAYSTYENKVEVGGSDLYRTLWDHDYIAHSSFFIGGMFGWNLTLHENDTNRTIIHSGVYTYSPSGDLEFVQVTQDQSLKNTETPPFVYKTIFKKVAQAK